jgi:hypothetical protein
MIINDIMDIASTVPTISINLRNTYDSILIQLLELN